jgi:putative transport protein
MFVLSEIASTIIFVFTIAAAGYLLGRIKVFGMSLGASGIFIVGLAFGHIGVTLPTVLQTMGLVIFITSVGLSAGPGFIQRMKRNGLSYAVLCVSTAAIGCAICFAVVRLSGMDASLAVGIMTGAFTTSPGFAAAKEAASSAEAAIQVAIGYGIAYPIGVICKVMFIQLTPKLLKADMARERELISLPLPPENNSVHRQTFQIDKLGLFVLSVTAVLGIFLGSVVIPLPNGGRFSLGTTGGPLVLGLLFGSIGKVGCLDLQMNKSVVTPTKEIGLLLFFSGAGVEGGRGIAKIIASYGFTPLLYGLAFVMLPLCGGFLMFRYILKLPLLNGLGSLAASMTCTPSLAVLIDVAETDDVTAAYATTYPIALITLVLVVQFLVAL